MAVVCVCVCVWYLQAEEYQLLEKTSTVSVRGCIVWHNVSKLTAMVMNINQ